MNIRSFIGLSAAILLAWLGVTYFHEVPTERYRLHSRSSTPITGKTVDATQELIVENETRNH